MRNRKQKLCPQCGKPDRLDAERCNSCGHGYRTRFSPQRRLPFRLIRLLVILAVGVAVGRYVWLHASPKAQTPEHAFSPETMKELNADPAAPDIDPVTAKAKTEIENARQEYSIPDTKSVATPDGQIHLRSGKTIKPEDYEAAKKAVENSPLLNTPPGPQL